MYFLQEFCKNCIDCKNFAKFFPSCFSCELGLLFTVISQSTSIKELGQCKYAKQENKKRKLGQCNYKNVQMECYNFAGLQIEQWFGCDEWTKNDRSKNVDKCTKLKC